MALEKFCSLAVNDSYIITCFAVCSALSYDYPRVRREVVRGEPMAKAYKGLLSCPIQARISIEFRNSRLGPNQRVRRKT